MKKPLLALGLLLAIAVPAFAQTPTLAIGPIIDIVGEWSSGAGTMEEQPLRGLPGPEVGEFPGVPMNEAARVHANTWQPTVLSLPEWQARPHPVTYAMRTGNFRLTADRDPIYGNIIAYQLEGFFGRADRTIYMDGRPRPSKYAEHKYQGFSLGGWENGALKVVTTHIKYAFVARNGVPVSPYAVVTEYFVPHGPDLITHFYIVDDPVYFTEPFVRTEGFRRARLQQVGRAFAPEVVEELSTLKRGDVPAYPFGTQRSDFSDMHGIPLEAAMGGAQTSYPEYQKRLQELMKNVPKPATPTSPTERQP